MTELRDILERLLQRRDLAESEAAGLLVALTDPAVAPAMSGALLAALRAKGITADEVRGFAGAMRGLARRPELPPGPPAVDVVGTGGDASGSFNLSTGAALLVAATGVRVVKHGNRSVSSRSGSADLLEALGLPLPLDERAAGECLAETGFTFLFAPHYHPAMKEVAPVRRALGVRTVFNLLGPLTNPAEPPFSLIGAYSARRRAAHGRHALGHADRARVRDPRRARLGRGDARGTVRALRRAARPRDPRSARPARPRHPALHGRRPRRRRRGAQRRGTARGVRRPRPGSRTATPWCSMPRSRSRSPVRCRPPGRA
jgi:hypothetical protein